MSSKKKMVIAISSFAMVLLAVIVGVVAVLAAREVTIQSSINIAYSVEDVFGYAKTSYKYEGDTSYSAWMAETDLTGTLTPQSKTFNEISKTKTYVIIKFEFKKLNATVEDFSAVLNYSSTSDNNIKVTYGTTESAITSTATATMFSGTEITSAEYQAFYVKIAVVDTKLDATFAGNFEWALENISND